MFSRLAPAALILSTLIPSVARAQEVKSADLAKQLAQLLDQKKIDAIAAPDLQTPGGYLAALYFPGTQLLVVSAKYSAPALLTELLARKDYKGVYAELTSASIADSKIFVMDAYANGLAVKPSGSNPPDSIEHGVKQTVFDGGWKKAKISEADYMKAFADADAAYARALQGLINHLKASGT
ncbi:MAG TPA: hypothetical protein VEL51_19740 [Vicinamibacterales bacterium]|nr:hypothetical protein [Vicinamibacterales bacterium]